MRIFFYQLIPFFFCEGTFTSGVLKRKWIIIRSWCLFHNNRRVRYLSTRITKGSTVSKPSRWVAVTVAPTQCSISHRVVATPMLCPVCHRLAMIVAPMFCPVHPVGVWNMDGLTTQPTVCHTTLTDEKQNTILFYFQSEISYLRLYFNFVAL
jgi:hypothetical protein